LYAYHRDYNPIETERHMTTQFKFAGMGSNRRFGAGRLSRALLAAVIIAAAMPVAAGNGGCPAQSGAAPEPTAGQFTGRFVNGAPVYRLSSITVSANRAAVIPTAEHQERLTRAGQVKTKAMARRPA
jgi:hypothetical protein